MRPTTISDGGPAFPNVTEGAGGRWTEWDKGMSLRDYFAAAALPGVVSAIMQFEGHGWSATSFANEAYQIADAMLKARAGDAS